MHPGAHRRVESSVIHRRSFLGALRAYLGAATLIACATGAPADPGDQSQVKAALHLTLRTPPEVAACEMAPQEGFGCDYGLSRPELAPESARGEHDPLGSASQLSAGRGSQ